MFPDKIRSVNESIRLLESSLLSVEQLWNYIHTLKEIASEASNNPDKWSCCNELMHKLTMEEQSRPFHEQFPEVNMSMEEMKRIAATLLKSSKEQSEKLNSIHNISRKHDKKLEEFVNNAVAKYFCGNVILSGYKYKTESKDDGEVDGDVVGINETGKDTIVFIETKSDMDSAWRKTVQQMHKTIAHWRYLKEIITGPENADDREMFKEDIEKFQVENLKDFEVRCAFGANFFSDETTGQFKDFI